MLQLIRQCQYWENRIFGDCADTAEYGRRLKCSGYIGFSQHGFIVGYLRVFAEFTAVNGPIPYLWLCGVDESARGRGVFRQMLRSFAIHYSAHLVFAVKTFPSAYPEMAEFLSRKCITCICCGDDPKKGKMYLYLLPNRV